MEKSTDTLPIVGRRKEGYSGPPGLIKQGGSENWYIKTRIGDKFIYKSTRTPDLEKAMVILSRVRVALSEPEDEVWKVIGKAIFFWELIGRYLREISITKRSYESDTVRSKPLIEFFGDRRIDTITTQDVYQYQDHRKGQIGPRSKKLLTGQSINREVSLLLEVIKKAVRWGHLPLNPIPWVERFPEKKRARYIKDEEFKAIKNVALSNHQSEHLADVMDILYHTSQRLGRILTLKWGQVDFKERTIQFEQLVENKKVPFGIVINEYLYSLLSKLRSQNRLSKVVSPYVISNKSGKAYRSIIRTWKTCCKKAGVEDARIHDIRHKAITDMVKDGHSYEKVGMVAGHSNPSTTKFYTHLNVDDTRGPLESLAKRVANC